MKSAEMIGWALGGLEREILTTRERLSSLTAQANALRTKLGKNARGVLASVTETETTDAATGKRTRRRRRVMSAEARKRISDNMKKRWAERKKKGQNKL